MEMNITDITVVQLKRWLEVLNLPTKGTKVELFSRLAKVPREMRGNAPEDVEETVNAQLEEEEDDEIEAEYENLKQLRAEIEKARKKLASLNRQIDDASNSQNSGKANGAAIADREGRGSGREASRGDNDGRGRGREASRGDDISEGGGENEGSGRGGGRGSGRGGGRDGDRSDASDEIQQNRARNESACLSSPGFAMAKEMLTDFFSKDSIKLWIDQWENISRLYDLSDMQRRVLLLSKLKGDAMQWLHADAGSFTAPISVLLDKLKLAFGDLESKSTLRRKFEARTWSSTEKFGVYFEDKCRLARDVAVEEEELIDGLVEGIPLPSLRTQAKLQCFDTPGRMLRAFSDIRLPEKSVVMTKAPVMTKSTVKAVAGSSESRCFNCNGKGHWMRDCIKPKRAPGSCYGCGAEGHRIAECPQNKKKADNNYNAK